MTVATARPDFDFEDAPSAPLILASLAFDVVTTPSLIEAEWRSLEILPRNSLNQGFDWASTWWSAQNLSPLILRGQMGGRTVMLLPLEVVPSYGLKTARFPGERFNNINTGLFSADFPVLSGDDLSAFRDAIIECLAPFADTLVLDTMPEVWNEARNPFADFATRQNPNPSFQLPLHPSMEETIAQLNAKTRRKRYRSQCRRLEAIGGFSHDCPDTAQGQHALLDLFFRQKAERFAGFGLPDVFQPPEIQLFFHDLIDRSIGVRDYPLRMHALRLHGENEGSIVALGGLSRKGGHVLCQFASIDDKLCPDASPGELLFWLMIEEVCQEDATVFDFGVGDQRYKHSWCPVTTVTQDLVLPLTAKGRLAMPILDALAQLRVTVKRNPKIYASIQKARALLRR
ncbi:CelD/BcsL family acetyltransferase involved in cellulose biosynthesis [Pseudorhizobium tarimense]|uniref:CelD/BcsL family acetyltransferase involved in cellulose biosynthesis n=1 Tax=Pseudorhizobium tarimense TaxID=1079109 RepID=A0ABV2HDU1_9HYPH|nr:GNAT family N-acetyltransferase [Pseudorhizobium tarimense]MCJ8521692.1 GNAT family N-acetyltransferase [Pseudorhizobium tarimense]